MPLNNEIFVVDDDADVCGALSMAFSLEGYQATIFRNGTSFIAAARAQAPACVLLDVHMPVKTGLDILRELDARTYPAPILIMSGSSDIPTAVAAITEGACDFVEKRLGSDAIIARVRETIDNWPPRRRHISNGDMAAMSLSFPGYDRLSPRERDVLREIMSGATSKAVANTLGTRPRTVENQRNHIMQKLGAKNAMDLVRIVLSK